jgi:NAD(P)-dependent dehydrogenase (short-subunit alcohol dehydrogenase family)
MESQSKKVALISGANKGIGLEVARQLGRNGCSVLIGARDVELGQAAASKLRSEYIDAHFLELDLASRQSIDAAAALIAKEHGKPDILVNNAGIADPSDGPPSTASADAVIRTRETNFLSALSVTQAMLPSLRQSPAGRIVNVSSGLGSLTHHGDPHWEFASVKFIGYCASKAALNMLTIQLAYELRDTPIKVNSADPGFTATDLNGHRGYQTIEQGAAETVRLSLLPADGPTGGFFSTSGPEPW